MSKGAALNWTQFRSPGGALSLAHRTEQRGRAQEARDLAWCSAAVSEAAARDKGQERQESEPFTPEGNETAALRFSDSL